MKSKSQYYCQQNRKPEKTTPCLIATADPMPFLYFFFYRLWYNAHLSHTVEYIMDPQGLNYFISESEPFSLY